MKVAVRLFGAVLLAALAACGSGKGPAPSATAQPTAIAAPSPTTAVSSPAGALFLEDLRGVETTMVRIRALQPQRPANEQFITRKQAEDKIRAEAKEEDSVRGLNQLQELLPLWDAVDPRQKSQVADLYINLNVEQVLGFYDTRTGELFVVQDAGSSAALAKVTLAHEYVHLLQDQNFGLKALDDETKLDIDRGLALEALIEGDATLAQFMYIFQILSDEERSALFAELDALQQQFPISRYPLFFQKLLGFPYDDGLRFVQFFYSRTRGFSSLNPLFVRPPLSTEQVLHPQKYALNEKPLPVDLPDLSKTLGQAWKLADSSTFGEFLLRTYLSLQIQDDALVKAAAAGWGGDKWNLYEASGGRRLFLLRIVWDSLRDADEFFQAYQQWLDKRSDGQSQALDADRLLWKGREKSIFALRRGDITYVVISASDGKDSSKAEETVRRLLERQ